jgi:hypothetical protein
MLTISILNIKRLFQTFSQREKANKEEEHFERFFHDDNLMFGIFLKYWKNGFFVHSS